MMGELALALSGLSTGALTVAAAERRARAARRLGVRRVAHELRGPITAVRLGVQLGARTGELSAERLRALDLELGRAGLALEDLAELEALPRPRRRERVDVRDLAHESVLAWSASAELHGRRLRLELPPGPVSVPADRIRLGQLLGNLLANAIEHGGGEIAVSGGRAGDRVWVQVRDHGPGLPAAVAARLSASGCRSGVAGRRRGPRWAGVDGAGERAGARGRGSRPRGAIIRRRRAEPADPRHGHGLAIAAEIAAQHHGSLTAAPCEDGARLILELPLER